MSNGLGPTKRQDDTIGPYSVVLTEEDALVLLVAGLWVAVTA